MSAVVAVGSLAIGNADVAARSRTTPIALGAYVSGAPWHADPLDRFTALVGRVPAIVMWYQDWGTPGSREFDAAKLQLVAARGATPLITWDPWAWADGPHQPEYSPARIAAGQFDDYIREWARGARGWGKRLYLRFAHEMNAAYYPWGVGNNGNTAADFVAAWRRVVDIFRQEGASEVRWIWSPNVAFHGTAPFRSVYPGRDYVDVLALDGYNWGPIDAWHTWTSLTGVFRSSYDELAALDSKKPMMIAETASTEYGGDKAAWIKSGLLTEMPVHFPRVKAVIWFHEHKETSWHVDSSVESLQAFREVAAHARYQGRLP
jgi:beta-mannanase